MALGLFDIVGPVMHGPSSNHTGGANRIGYLAWGIMGGTPDAIHLGFHRDYMKSYAGQHTHSAMIAGLLGYFMNKFEYPTSPMLLAFVLTDFIEKNLYRSLMVNNGSPSLYWTKPITVVLLLVTVALMVSPIILNKIKAKKEKN